MSAGRLTSPLVLGIESSCDDTACALVDGAGRVHSTIVSRQIEAHRPFGGVVPEIASREHLGNWPAVSHEALTAAGVDWTDIDAVAATRGPGLVGCLLVGLSLGRSLAYALEKPFHGLHHLEGHLYSPFLALDGEEAADVPERFHGLVVSGGHTSLLEVDRGEVRSLVETRDDAMGEVFDKVGKRLGLAYPQGPKVDQAAEQGTVDEAMKSTFKVAAPKADLFFSYSGLKSQALREIERLERAGVVERNIERTVDELPQEARDLLAGFRRAAVRQIVRRLEQVHRRGRREGQPIETLAVSGGAAANRLLRRELTAWAEAHEIDLRLVPLRYAGDNAAMIAFAAVVRERLGLGTDPRATQVASRIPFGR